MRTTHRQKSSYEVSLRAPRALRESIVFEFFFVTFALQLRYYIKNLMDLVE